MDSSPKGAVLSRSRLHTSLAVALVFLLSLAGIYSSAPSAKAVSFPGKAGPGYLIVDEIVDGGAWFGALENPNGNSSWLVWCIQAGYVNPVAGDSVTASTLDNKGIQKNGQGEFTLTVPQIAVLLKDKESIETADSRAALSFLIHANLDIGANGYTGAQLWAKTLPAVQKHYPQVVTLARDYVQYAKNSAAVGYKSITIDGEGTREGTINNICITNEAGNCIPGRKITITLDKNAVFTSTNSKEITLTSASTLINGVKWKATANGPVTYTIKFEDSRKTLTKYGVNGDIQDTITYREFIGSDIEWTNGPKDSFEVIYDFQPILESQVEKKVLEEADTEICDTLTVGPQTTYGNGEWTKIDGKYVPVTFKGVLRYQGITPGSESASAPTSAVVEAETSIVAEGPGQHTVCVDRPEKAGFYNWQWSVTKADQGEWSTYVHDNWADKYGLADETTSNPHKIEIDSEVGMHAMKSGIYIFDSLMQKLFPADHGTYTGTAGFGGDTLVIEQRGYFVENVKRGEILPEHETDENLICTVEVTAKNSYSHAETSSDCMVPVESEGEFAGVNKVGTWVWVTFHAGSDRVYPFKSDITDIYEQIEFTREAPTTPQIGTQALVNESGSNEAKVGDRLGDQFKVTAEDDTVSFEAGTTTVSELFYAADGETLTCTDKPIWTSAPVEVTTAGTYQTSDSYKSDKPGTYGFVEVTRDSDGLIVSKGECGEPSETVKITEEKPVTPSPSTSSPGPDNPGNSLAKTGATATIIGIIVVLLAGVGGGLVYFQRRRSNN